MGTENQKSTVPVESDVFVGTKMQQLPLQMSFWQTETLISSSLSQISQSTCMMIPSSLQQFAV